VKTLVEAEKQTAERFEHREAQKTKRGATYAAHTEGRAICEALLPALAEFMLSREAPTPPEGLERVIHQLKQEELAFVALSPLLHQIAVGWKTGDKSAVMKLKLAMGRALHDKLLMRRLLKENRGAYGRIMKANNRHRAIWKYRQPRWSNEQYVRAGHWLLDCVLTKLDGIFVLGWDGLPCVTKEGEEYALALCAEFVYRNPVFLPTTEPLQDWISWRAGGYWDDGTRISATFVRDSHPATEIAIRRAFRDGSMGQHVDGVNALQRVAWAINAAMLPVVEQFAGKVGKKVSKLLVAHDIATANVLRGKKFYVPMNCDFRGRVYGVPHFNFQREDHVRALFQFAQGMPIGDDGRYWLAVHVANCGDFDRISKRPFHERVAWVKANRQLIMSVAQDPTATVEWWRDADAPFSFVAGCIELAAAWEAGPSYITHLPVCFDGSCSGVQHLAMSMRDEDAGRFVNLIASDEPQDIYQLITEKVKERVGAKLDDWIRRTKRIKGKEVLLKPRAEYARFWNDKLNRKLIKRPAMTFAYSVTPDGMRQQLVDVYKEQHQGAEPTDAAGWYLASHIMATANEVLKRPAVAMKFIRKLAEQRADKGKPLEWTSPTGFPWANRYCKSNVEIVHLESRGEYVRHVVGDGFRPGILKGRSMNAAAPNFVHALDASHLIRVVNAAADEGITSIAVVHDCFGCLAPQARDLHRIIRTQFAELYSQDVLADLRKAAGSSEPIPAKGSLDPWGVLHSEYAFA
jgi:DNA-directed RNA polymerase